MGQMNFSMIQHINQSLILSQILIKQKKIHNEEDQDFNVTRLIVISEANPIILQI